MEEEDTIEGYWTMGAIGNDGLTWRDGSLSNINISSSTTFSLELDGTEYSATLKDGQLYWSNGDVWTRKKKVVIDIETSDPDDLYTLLIVAGHPAVDLKAVNVCPGTRAQVLLVHEALNKLAQKDKTLEYLRSITIGYDDLDKDTHKPFAWAEGELYNKFFKGSDWDRARQNETQLKTIFSKMDRKVKKGWEVLLDFCDASTTLVIGGPLTNLKKTIEECLKHGGDFMLGTLVAQGGFAGKNVVSLDALKQQQENASRDMDDYTNPAHNFDLDYMAAIVALNEFSTGITIRERIVASKNVCHQTTYDAKLGKLIKMQLAHMSNRPPAYLQKLVPEGYSKREAPASIAESSLGLELFQSMFEESGKAPGTKGAEIDNAARGKKLHDLVAGLAAIDPRATGCGWRRVNLRWSRTENMKLLSTDGRAKNGGEWACIYAVGEEVSKPQREPEGEELVVDEESVYEKPFAVAVYEGDTWMLEDQFPYDQMWEKIWNTWITVSVDLDLFAQNLAGI